MNTQSLKYYRTRHGAFGIVPSDSPIVGDAVEVGAARKEEYAKLFAAAPELLEALQDCVSVLVQFTDAQEKPWFKAAQAAIAKATE